jgi:hypothetical protein
MAWRLSRPGALAKVALRQERYEVDFRAERGPKQRRADRWYGPDSIASKGKLASATKTIRNGLFCRSFLIQLAMGVGLSFMWRMTAVAPTTSRGIFPERGRARALTLCCPAVGRNEMAGERRPLKPGASEPASYGLVQTRLCAPSSNRSRTTSARSRRSIQGERALRALDINSTRPP